MTCLDQSGSGFYQIIGYVTGPYAEFNFFLLFYMIGKICYGNPLIWNDWQSLHGIRSKLKVMLFFQDAVYPASLGKLATFDDLIHNIPKSFKIHYLSNWIKYTSLGFRIAFSMFFLNLKPLRFKVVCIYHNIETHFVH